MLHEGVNKVIENLSEQFRGRSEERNTLFDSFVENMRIQLIGCGVCKTEIARLDNFLLPAFLMVSYTQGTTELSCQGRSVLLNPGSFYVFRPYELYSGVRKSGEPLVFSYLQFDITPFLDRFHFGKTAFSAADGVLPESEYRGFGQMLETLAAEEEQKDGRAAMLRLLAKHVAAQLLYDRIGQSSRAEWFRGNRETRLINHTFQYTAQHLSEPIAIGRIIREAATSKTSLDRAFRNVLRCTPQQALLQFKVERAAELLRENVALKTIAKDLGFCSVSHFSNTFQSIMGLRPAEYRREKRATENIGPIRWRGSEA